MSEQGMNCTIARALGYEAFAFTDGDIDIGWYVDGKYMSKRCPNFCHDANQWTSGSELVTWVEDHSEGLPYPTMIYKFMVELHINSTWHIMTATPLQRATALCKVLEGREPRTPQ